MTMNITSARYNVPNSGIAVTLDDGTVMHIPNDMANRERRRLAVWEAAGGVIGPYVAPAPTADQIRTDTFKALPERVDLVGRLSTATPTQIDAWLATNVTTLAQARVVLGAILKYLAARGVS